MVYKTLSTDFYYENSGITSLSYYITADNGTIYTGRAFNPNGIKINVRKAIDDWLVNEMPDFREYDGVMVEHEDAFKVFGLRSSDGTLLEEYGVFLTYEDNWLSEVTYRGIDGKADPRQKIFVGVLSDSPVDVVLDIVDKFFFNIEDVFVSDEGGTVRIPYSTNYRQSEFDVSVSSGATLVSVGNGYIEIFVPANYSKNQKTYTIYVHRVSNGALIATSTVKQRATGMIGKYLTLDVISGGTFYTYASSGVNFEYSMDGGNTWTEIPNQQTTISVNKDDRVLFKGVNGDEVYVSGLTHGYFMRIWGDTAVYNVYGNILSVIYGDDFGDYRTITCGYPFRDMFSIARVVDASGLILPDNLTEGCYMGMFGDASSLIAAPELPSVEIAPDRCYQQMFQGTALVTAPEIKQKTIGYRSMYGMFAMCSELTVAPELYIEDAGEYSMGALFSGASISSVTITLADEYPAREAYAGMFMDCSLLTNTPTILAKTVSDNCFQNMFELCTSLVNPPDLSSVTDVRQYGMSGMFDRCTSLVSSPDLLATATYPGCYRWMFNGCSSLNYVKCTMSYYNSERTFMWMNGVPATGTFVKKSGVTWGSGESGVPSGWTIQDAV